VRIVQENGRSASAPEPQQHLVKLLHTARSWWQELCQEQLTASELASRKGINKSYLSRVIRLASLSPEIIDAVPCRRSAGGTECKDPAIDARSAAELGRAATLLHLNEATEKITASAPSAPLLIQAEGQRIPAETAAEKIRRTSRNALVPVLSQLPTEPQNPRNRAILASIPLHALYFSDLVAKEAVCCEPVSPEHPCYSLF